jgi:hypothetical protein
MITNVIPGCRIKLVIKPSFWLQLLAPDLANVDDLSEGWKLEFGGGELVDKLCSWG